MLRGSAHPRNTLGSISSIEGLFVLGACANAAGAIASNRAADAIRRHRPDCVRATYSMTSLRHAAIFPLGRGLRLFFMLARTAARDSVIRARAQIYVDVIDVAHHVFVGAKRRHDVL